MKTQLLIKLTAIALLISNLAIAQQPNLMQKPFNSSLILPSFTGLAGKRITANYRNQWVKITSSPTYTLAYDHDFNRKNNLGAFVYRNQIGDKLQSINYEAALQYAFHSKINNNWNFSLGCNASYTTQQFKGDLTQINSNGKDIDYKNIPADLQKNRKLYSSGSLLLFNSNYAIGGGFKYLLHSEQSEEDYIPPLTLTAVARAKFNLNKRDVSNKRISLMVSVINIYDTTQNQLQIGTYLNLYDILFCGLSCQAIDIEVTTLSPLIGIKFNNYNMYYSYDYSFSDLSNSTTGGSHEITLIYSINNNSKKKPISCPMF